METWDQTIGKEVNAIVLHTQLFGKPIEGQLPLILLHGWANSINVISPFAESLAKFFFVFELGSVDL